MATLLGKSDSTARRFDDCAKIAFNRALDYLPNTNFVYIYYNTVCDEDGVVFNDSGISGSCVEGCGVKVYSFKMPNATGELFIYHSACWYITIKCQWNDGSFRYIEFAFDEASNRVGRSIYEF